MPGDRITEFQPVLKKPRGPDPPWENCCDCADTRWWWVGCKQHDKLHNKGIFGSSRTLCYLTIHTLICDYSCFSPLLTSSPEHPLKWGLAQNSPLPGVNAISWCCFATLCAFARNSTSKSARELTNYWLSAGHVLDLSPKEQQFQPLFQFNFT